MYVKEQPNKMPNYANGVWLLNESLCALVFVR